MEVLDFKKEAVYKAGVQPRVVDVPEMLFVTAAGAGLPDASRKAQQQFQEAIGALYAVVYTLKFWDKKHDVPQGYAKWTATPLEGLWWTTAGHNFDTADPNEWQWKLMLRVPPFVTSELFAAVTHEVSTKKPNVVLNGIQLEKFYEGRSVQMLHVGPYDAEQPTIAALHDFAKQHGYALAGKHHELYIGNPRRTRPEKLRTILRHPVR